MVACAEQRWTSRRVAALLRYAWLVPLLPFASASADPVLRQADARARAPISGSRPSAVGLVLSLGMLWHFVTGGGADEDALEWFTIGPAAIELGQYVDGLTAVMLVRRHAASRSACTSTRWAT